MPRTPNKQRPEAGEGYITDCSLRTVVSAAGQSERTRVPNVLRFRDRNGGWGLCTAGELICAGTTVFEEKGLQVSAAERIHPERLIPRIRNDDIEWVKQLESQGKGWDSEEGMSALLDTNAFSIDSGVDSDISSALFETISRINHSCIPNCAVNVTSTAEASVVTLVDIPPFTELSISYGGEEKGWSTACRRRMLLGHKFFVCGCVLCGEEDRMEQSFEPDMTDFILSHTEGDCGKSLEEYIAGMHVVGEVHGFSHWGVAFIAKGLLSNSIAGVEATQEAVWVKMSLTLLRFLTNWGRHVWYFEEEGVLSFQPSWFVLFIVSVSLKLLDNAAEFEGTLPTVRQALLLVHHWHARFYPKHEDTLTIAKVLLETEGVEMVDKGAEGVKACTAASVTVHAGGNSPVVIRQHVERILKEVNSL